MDVRISILQRFPKLFTLSPISLASFIRI
jgi:hypothetical protein